jgi:hypothetical protein
MNGLTFNSEGPIMSGTWYNTITGDSFTVEDSFFEDNQYVVKTTDGRYLKYEQIQNYIKSDKPLDMNNLRLDKSQAQEPVNDLPPEVMGLLETDDSILSTPIGNLYGPVMEPVFTAAPKTQANTSNYTIISKALSKRSLPDIQIGIDWNKCPLKEMKMLIDLMDVTEDEIIEWYINNIDVNTTTQIIKSSIKTYIQQLFNPEQNTKAKKANKKTSKK